MRIHQLQKSKWLKDKARRRGRGNATGTGNYSGRGLKGQKSRSWFSMKPFFEGWQTSIVQRLPKARGFTRYFKLVKDVSIINLGALDADPRIKDDMEITKQLLKDLGYIKSATAFVKILSHGNYSKHLTFKDIDAFSASTKTKMEKPWTQRSVSKKAPAKVVKDKKSKVWKLKTKSTGKKPVTKQPVVKQETIKKVEVKKVEEVKKIPVQKPIVDQKTVVKKVAEKKEVVTKAPVKKAADKKETTPKKTAAKKPTAKKAKYTW